MQSLPPTLPTATIPFTTLYCSPSTKAPCDTFSASPKENRSPLRAVPSFLQYGVPTVWNMPAI